MGEPGQVPTKLKKVGQAKAGAGWNQHVNKYQKRVGNKIIRRVLKKEEEEQR